jgi:ribosomal protein S18 acetylase RimI-like enzyme
MIEIRRAESHRDLAEVRDLFREYATIPGIEVCLQSFDEELARIPGPYAPPEGRLLIAWSDGEAAGCVGLRKIQDGVCEMNRLFVRPAFRGTGAGRALASSLMEEARRAGYDRMRLETLPAVMAEAVFLYRSLGFEEVPAGGGPAGALVMEIDLL